MIMDFYAALADQKACPNQLVPPVGLAAGFVDGCTEWATRGDREKNDARRRYLKLVGSMRALAAPGYLSLEPDFRRLPSRRWIGIEVVFTLETPWYSRDNRPFHVLENPVRKDRLFGVPFMAAASWKGLLRWACRRRELAEEEVRHLFGNEKGEDVEFQRGALAFYPTWFDRLGFEVINPHSRKTRAGTQPIYYEVVPAGANGVLRLLYAPSPGGLDASFQAAALCGLLKAADDLLRTYGISGKRTVGWGTARPDRWGAYRAGGTLDKASASELAAALGAWLGSSP